MRGGGEGEKGGERPRGEKRMHAYQKCLEIIKKETAYDCNTYFSETSLVKQKLTHCILYQKEDEANDDKDSLYFLYFVCSEP